MDAPFDHQTDQVSTFEPTQPRLPVHCLNCGSDSLDVSAAPRGDEIVQCFACGDWNSYLTLELAEIDIIRRSLSRKKIAKL